MRRHSIIPVGLLLIAGFVLSMAAEPPAVNDNEQQPGQPCDIRLDKLNKKSGKTGDTFEMIGKWGPIQGSKRPCINKGRMNSLIVVRWTPSALLVRIPDALEPGTYRVGVYCSDPILGSTYSSNWLDFKIVAVSR